MPLLPTDETQADLFEEWRGHPYTTTVIGRIGALHQRAVEELAHAAGSTSVTPERLRVLGGYISGLAAALDAMKRGPNT